MERIREKIKNCCSDAQRCAELCKKCEKRFFNAFSEVQNLQELLEFLKVFSFEIFDGLVNYAELPIFGGKEPEDTTEIWSWDKNNLIVGNSAYDFKIISRVEWDEK